MGPFSLLQFECFFNSNFSLLDFIANVSLTKHTTFKYLLCCQNFCHEFLRPNLYAFVKLCHHTWVKNSCCEYLHIGRNMKVKGCIDPTCSHPTPNTHLWPRQFFPARSQYKVFGRGRTNSRRSFSSLQFNWIWSITEILPLFTPVVR